MTATAVVPTVTLRIEDAVARLTIARPQRRNALDDDGWLQLAQYCQELASRQDIRVVVLSGEGGHFCAGADIHELAHHVQDAAWMQENQVHVGDALDGYAALPQPTIAAIRGCCFGGGAALAVASDFRIATSDARFAITPTKLGLTYRLVDCLRVNQLIGPARTRELLLRAREVDAETAKTWGLIGEMVAAEKIDDAVSACVAQLKSLSGYSQRGIKASLLKIRDGATSDDAATRQIFRDAFAGHDFAEASAAFIAKRPPTFS